MVKNYFKINFINIKIIIILFLATIFLDYEFIFYKFHFILNIIKFNFNHKFLSIIILIIKFHIRDFKLVVIMLS